MHTKTIDVQDAQTNLPDLLSLVRKGTEVVLTDGRTPLARLVPVICSTQPRVAGLHTGAIGTSDDFDEPLREHNEVATRQFRDSHLLLLNEHIGADK